MKEGRRVLLIDGHSLAYRAFFALPDTMSTTGGQPTNAVYGFTSMLLKVLSDEKPDSVIVAFDGPRAELKRTRAYPEYKAHRPTMPDPLRSQIEMIDHLLEHMKVPRVAVPGYEADDILGTLARRVAEGGDEAVVLTGDKDVLQLTDDGIRIVLTTKGITETESYDREKILEKYGLPPERLPDVAGLKGDTSDNIPGVPGIGEKGACSLIQQYGSLDGVYDHLGEVSGAKRKAALEENRELAFLSRELATIDSEVPLDLDVGEVRFGEWDRQEVIDYLSVLEFKTLARRFLEVFGGAGEVEAAAGQEEISLRLVDLHDSEAVGRFASEAMEAGAVAVASNLAGGGYCDIELLRLGMATRDSVLLVPFDGGAAHEPVVRAARELLDAPLEKWFHDAKGTLEALDKKGMKVSGPVFDCFIAAYLENPSLGNYYLWDLWERNVGKRVTLAGLSVSEVEQPSLLEDDQGDADVLLATEAARIFHLKPALAEKIEGLDMTALLGEIEMPLLFVLESMEKTGVALDVPVIDGLAAEAGIALGSLEKEIHALAGHEFNVGSTRQLGQVLFEEMGIPPVKKTKTGYSTDSSVLEFLKADHEIAGKIIEYREHAKLKSTYLDALPLLVCPATGRIHCQFNQAATATGRISSSNPNMQNIPVRTEVGRKIRSAFRPGREGWKLLVADYSQIELRVLAHMSSDAELIRAFEQDADIHTETAARIFNVPHAEVTGEMRRMAKVVNFGVVYGMGYYGLSTRLGISLEDATEYIDTYFDRYPQVSEYRERCITEAAERGYAETLLGRRRLIPQLASANRQTRELGERLAINTPLQGTAADIIKKAMVEVARAIDRAGMKSALIIQIHDELLLELPPEESDELTGIVTGCMGRAAELKVELKVDSGIYDDWGQAKS